MNFKVLASSSKGNCYVVENSKGERLVIEAGIRYKEILKGLDYSLSNVVGALVSHFHMDHAKAVKDLVKNAVDVYASKETFSELGIESHRANSIESEKQFKVGSYTVLPFGVEHDAPGSLGYLIQCDGEKLLFITDTCYCQYKFKVVDMVVIECNCSNKILMENIECGTSNPVLVARILKSHFSLENVIGFLQANDQSKLKNVVLIHLSDTNSNAREFQAEVERATGKTVYVADKGLEIVL